MELSLPTLIGYSVRALPRLAYQTNLKEYSDICEVTDVNILGEKRCRETKMKEGTYCIWIAIMH